MALINKDMSLDLNKVREKKYKIDVLQPKTYDESRINLYLFEKVIDNLDDVKDFVGLCYDPKECKRVEWNGTKTILTETFKRKKKNPSVIYAPTKSNPKGRHFSKEKSLQGMSRTIRHLICHENYTDIDIKNCHPVVLVQLCKLYNFDCSHIEFYNNNRDKCLDELMNITKLSKDECKQSLLSLLNGGSCSKIFNNFEVPDWFTNYAIQIEKIHNNFVEHDDLKGFVKEITKNHSKDCFNFNGKVVNRLLCQFENIILQHAIHYCSLNNICVASPQFDGFICENNDKINNEFLQELENYIYEEVGLSVKFAVKEMTEHIPLAERLANMKTNSELLEEEKREKRNKKRQEKEQREAEKERKKREMELPLPNCSDENLALVFLERIGDNIMYHAKHDNFYIYNSDDCLWKDVPVENTITLLSSVLLPYIDELILDCESNIMLDRYEKMKNNICCTKKQLDILRQIKNRLVDNSIFIESNFNKLTTIFPYKKNIINLKTKETRLRTKDDYFTFTTDNEYISEISESDRNLLYKYIREIIYPPDYDDDNEYADSFLTLLSHLLTNDNSIKKIINLIGKSDTGKSAFISVLSKVMSEFWANAPRRLIVKSKNESVLGTEYMPLVNKRGIFISELAEDEKYNVPFLKSISGDDGVFPVRPSANKGYENYILSGKIVISSNEVPSYDDTDAFQKRLLYIEFPNIFEKNEAKKREILKLQNILFSILCEKAHLLIKNDYSFIPHENMIKKTQEINNEKDTIKMFFDENYEITNNTNDKILQNSLYPDYMYFCKNENLSYLNKNKFFKTLINPPYNFDKNNKDKYYRSHGKNYFLGIKKIDMLENNNTSNSVFDGTLLDKPPL